MYILLFYLSLQHVLYYVETYFLWKINCSYRMTELEYEINVSSSSVSCQMIVNTYLLMCNIITKVIIQFNQISKRYNSISKFNNKSLFEIFQLLIYIKNRLHSLLFLDFGKLAFYALHAKCWCTTTINCDQA